MDDYHRKSSNKITADIISPHLKPKEYGLQKVLEEQKQRNQMSLIEKYNQNKIPQLSVKKFSRNKKKSDNMSKIKTSVESHNNSKFFYLYSYE